MSVSSGVRACPRHYEPESCHLLSGAFDAPHLCVIVTVSGSSTTSGCTLPARLIQFLIDMKLPVEFSLLINAGVDDTCTQPAFKLMRDAGITLNVCKGDRCKGAVTGQCKTARMTLLIRDSVDFEPGTFEDMLSAAKLMPTSLVAPSLVAPSGLVRFGFPVNDFGLTKVDTVLAFCLLGYTESFVGLGAQAAMGVRPVLSGNNLFVHRSWIRMDTEQHMDMQVSKARDILFIDGYLPTPDKDSGSKRTTGFISLLIQQSFRVTFQPITSLDQVNLATVEESARYKRLMVAIGARLRVPNFPDAWPQETYDIIIVSRRSTMTHVINFLQKQHPQASILYDTVDLHFLRETRLAMASSVSKDTNLTNGMDMQAWLSHPSNEKAAAELKELRHLELSYMQKSHMTIVVSAYEEEVIKQYLPTANIAVISNIIPAPLGFDFSRAPRCIERSGILFVGQFGHMPNQQAIDVLLTYIIPEMQQRKKLPVMPDFHIVGSGKLPDALKQRLAAHKFVHVHVDLSDVELSFLYLEARVAIAPLVSGAGVKGKINQAMSLGVPVVGTSVAVESMHTTHGEDCMVADSLKQFVEHLEAVYTDDALCDKLAKNAYASVYKHFSLQTAGSQIRQALDRL